MSISTTEFSNSSHWLDRNDSFELRHDFKDLWVNRPLIQISHGTFEKWRHPRVSSLDVPIMACVIRIGPRYTNQANEWSNRVFLRMLVQELTNLRPKTFSYSAQGNWGTTTREDIPWNHINQYVIWCDLLLAHGRYQPIWMGTYAVETWPNKILRACVSVV